MNESLGGNAVSGNGKTSIATYLKAAMNTVEILLVIYRRML